MEDTKFGEKLAAMKRLLLRAARLRTPRHRHKLKKETSVRTTKKGKFAADQMSESISALSASDKPIVVGPWLSEVGFELLYWIPFVQWAIDSFNIDSSRVVVVSRGGDPAWYAHIGGRYIDLFDYMSPEEFRRLNDRRRGDNGVHKQMAVTETDRIFLRRVLGPSYEEYGVLHPSLMYRLLHPLWHRKALPSLAAQYARYAPLRTSLCQAHNLKLDKDCVVVKFYWSTALPETPNNRAAIKDILRRLAADRPVLVLRNAFRVDEHSDWTEDLPNQVKLLTIADGSGNLTLQSSIISQASLFVGTYGGFAYLAPFTGVPSIGLYSELHRIKPVHLDVALRVFRQLKHGNFEKKANSNDIGLLPRTRFAAIDIQTLTDLLPALTTQPS